jgi:indole-3-glycerol phosphate synthase
MMSTYLDSIVAWHRHRSNIDSRPLSRLVSATDRLLPTRGFSSRLQNGDSVAVIAEIKRRSPSKGVLVPSLDVADLARRYERAGAICMSVLTDSEHFGGSINDLQTARAATDLPVLRKDFTVDLRDVCDARLMGADCVLLIAAVLSQVDLRDMLSLARDIGLDALVEVHDEIEVARAVECDAVLIGVNQRDLVTFDVDHERAMRMGSVIPEACVRVAESGIRGRDDATSLAAAGYDALLVGEHLVRAEDTEAALSELIVPRHSTRATSF